MVGVDVGADVVVGVAVVDDVVGDAVVDDVVGDDDVGDGVAGRDCDSVVGMVVGASAASVCCWKRYAVSSTASSIASSTACTAPAVDASWRAAIATFQRISRLNDRPTPL